MEFILIFRMYIDVNMFNLQQTLALILFVLLYTVSAISLRKSGPLFIHVAMYRLKIKKINQILLSPCLFQHKLFKNIIYSKFSFIYTQQ